MARSKHSVLTAPDRFERRAARRQTPVVRRQSTRSAVVLAALQEA
jgi:hypothetical protein